MKKSLFYFLVLILPLACLYAQNNLSENTTLSKPAKRMVNVTLQVGNAVWRGEGFQLLLDATATQYGNAIPAEGIVFSTCPAPASAYNPFSHKIPTNAAPSCSSFSTYVRLGANHTIQIPAGTYDYCITNLEIAYHLGNYAVIWIADGPNNRKDNYLFQEGKNYHFLLRQNAAGDGDETIITITDNEDTCDPVANPTVVISDCKRATVTWTAVDGAKGYKVVRDGTLLGTFTSPTYTEVAAFEPNVTYTWSIITVCDDDESTGIDASGQCQLGIRDLTKTDFSIVPNPATHNITITSENSFHTVEIVSFLGQTVLTQPNDKNSADVDVSHLTNGIYFVRIISDAGTNVKKFVKQ